VAIPVLKAFCPGFQGTIGEIPCRLSSQLTLPSSGWTDADPHHLGRVQTHTLASPVDFTAHCHRCCAGARKGRHRSPLVSRPTRWSVRSPQTPSLPACPAMFRNTARTQRHAVTSRPGARTQIVTPHPCENREMGKLVSSSSCKRELAAQRDGLAAGRPSWMQREPTRPAGVTGKRWAVVHTWVRAGV